MKKTTIAILDDQPLICDGLKHYINNNEYLDCIFTANYENDLLEYLNDKNYPIPEIILLDIQLYEKDGIKILKELKKEFPEIKFVIISSHTEKNIIYSAYKYGADGYIKKTWPIEKIIENIYKLSCYNLYFDIEIQKIISNYNDSDDININFSKRELEILELLSNGNLTKEIANILNISISTVENHKANLLKKSKTNNSPELVCFALKNGYIHPF